MVPTVDRGLLEVVFCSMAITGESPSILSTSGRSRLPKIDAHRQKKFPYSDVAPQHKWYQMQA